MIGVTESEVYHTLSYHVWKSGIEIRDELRKVKGIGNPLENAKDKSGLKALAIILNDINLGSLYVNLIRLQRQGFAEQRYRELSREEPVAVDNVRQPEYRLTSGGIKARDLYTRDTTSTGLEGKLEPA